MKTWFRVIVVLSLVFLAASLYWADYLNVPQVVSGSALTASFCLLFAGFLAGTMCWNATLEASGYRVSGANCIAGMGMSIFGKYIPGKVWTIVGRAAYTAEKTDYTLTQTTLVSLQAQLLDIWTGLALGVIGLSIVGGLHLWGWPAIVLWILLTAVVFSSVVSATALAVGRRVLGIDLALPAADFKSTLSVIPWFVLAWVLWTVAFYFLGKALLPGGVSWNFGFAFPLAGTLGILAIFMPGGLGVREGALVGYLVLAGINVAEATTVAVASRLWFLIGEFFIFVVGALADRRLKKEMSNRQR